jgi:hypothetical protein
VSGRSNGLQTEFEFVLPRGYVDQDGNVHRQGTMRLSTAIDEIAPLRDPRVRDNQAYLTVVILSRVITRLGNLADVNTGVVESIFSADLAYLQNFYRQINENGTIDTDTTCPACGHAFPVGAVSSVGEP